MKKLILSNALCVLVAIGAQSCTKEKNETQTAAAPVVTGQGDAYALDTIASQVEWKGYKIFKSEETSHFGHLKFESGDVRVADGKLVGASFVTDISSLTVEDLEKGSPEQGKLENHLKSEDFFNVARFPTAAFVVTKVSPNTIGDYNTKLEGNMTIKGITQPVSLQANVEVKDDLVTIATEHKDISRSAFGINFTSPVENGVIKDEISIQVLAKARPVQ